MEPSPQFGHFPRLPIELRGPKVVEVRLRGIRISRVSTNSQALLFACKESRLVYIRYNTEFVFNKNHVSVNPSADFLYIDNFEDGMDITGSVLVHHASLGQLISCFRQIVLAKAIPGICDMLKCLPQLGELWVHFQIPPHFQPTSTSNFRRCWSAHHCDEFPEQYLSNFQRGEHKPCPVCHWRCGFGLLDGEAIGPRSSPSNFVLTCASSLPLLPTPDDIKRAACPVLRWIRHEDSDAPYFANLSDMEKREMFEAVAREYFERYERKRY
ncbi:hypothetical protein S40288_11552 [Stachybotrys chartarum IBT 40288]|nr:hypothetical protein S40288_11552 [Stachybotrys chartarum IBT 40288]